MVSGLGRGGKSAASVSGLLNQDREEGDGFISVEMPV